MTNDSMTQQPESDPSTMLPSLRAKLQQFIEGLTTEEQTQMYRLLLQAAGVGTTAGAEADVAGQMIAQYDDGFGNKGRPRAVEETGGGLDPWDLVPDRYKRIPGLVADGIRHFPR